MNTKVDFAPKSAGNHLGGSWMLVEARLKRLRRERRLVQRAIIALTEISRARGSRERRSARK